MFLFSLFTSLFISPSSPPPALFVFIGSYMPKYMLIALEPAKIRLEGDKSKKREGEGEMFSADQRKPNMSLNRPGHSLHG